MSPRELIQKKLKVSAKTAAQSAKQHLDQVLLGFQHPALQKLKSAQVAPGDLVQRVGQGVLARASEIRASLTETPSKIAQTFLRDLPIPYKASVIPPRPAKKVADDAPAKKVRVAPRLKQVATGKPVVTAKAGAKASPKAQTKTSAKASTAKKSVGVKKRASSSRSLK